MSCANPYKRNGFFYSYNLTAKSFARIMIEWP
jgi:hypothetical protein